MVTQLYNSLIKAAGTSVIDILDRGLRVAQPGIAQAVGQSAVLLIECKFPEGGGTCSQTKQRAGKKQCNGNFSEQVNPVNGLKSRCALTVKGIRYWKNIPAMMELDADIDHSPCPFAKDTYQWMRNAVLAHVVGERMGL